MEGIIQNIIERNYRMNRLEIFSKELNLIKNIEIRKFVETCLNEAPEYFF